MRFAIPSILILAAIGIFILYIRPVYQEVEVLNARKTEYATALDNSKKLQLIRDDLSNRLNAMNVSDRERLEKLLPDNVDNIKFIIDLQQIALKYGMVPREVKYDAKGGTTPATSGPGVAQDAASIRQKQQPYGTFDLDFAVTGNYQSFLAFVSDMEKNLRLVDISSVKFSNVGSSSDQTASEVYKYNFSVKTYWLKN